MVKKSVVGQLLFEEDSDRKKRLAFIKKYAPRKYKAAKEKGLL